LVTRTDKAFERFSLSRNGIMAPVLTVSENISGKVTYTCYKKIMKAVSAFEKECLDPFSEESAVRLRAIADPFMKKHGYSFDSDNTILEYMAKSPLPKGSAETVILKTNEEIKKYPADTTLWNLEVDDDDNADVICAVIEEGRLVAYACVNDMADGVGFEITVECAPSSRRRGFASSCSADLTSYLLTECNAGVVYYSCKINNETSKRTAERAGFTYVGKSRTFVYLR